MTPESGTRGPGAAGRAGLPRTGGPAGWSRPRAGGRKMGGGPLPAPLQAIITSSGVSSPHSRRRVRGPASQSPCAEAELAGAGAASSAMADRLAAPDRRAHGEGAGPHASRPAPAPAPPPPPTSAGEPRGLTASGVTPGCSPPTPLRAAALSGR